jgi:hypothetical protein
MCSIWERLLSWLSSLSQIEDTKNSYYWQDGYWVNAP